MRSRESKGFTLIELLVVVLIIGILAAIALPQYRLAVEKTRAVEALTLGKALISAQEVYYLTHSKYTDNFNDLDVVCPGTINVKGNECTTKYFIISLLSELSDSNLGRILIGRIPDSSQYYLDFYGQKGTALTGRIRCAVRQGPLDEKICQALSGKTAPDMPPSHYSINR
jgi:prepilin-type N-terminal cleavage/methylation domain-containing protein